MDAPTSRVSWPPPTRPTPTQTPSHPLGHFLNSQTAPSPPSLMPCHFPRARRTVAVHRVRAPVQPPPLRPRRARRLSEFCLGVQNSRHASIYSLSLWFSLPALTGPPSCSHSAITFDSSPRRAPFAIQGCQSLLSR
jgi:hypothetical protein